MRRELWILGCGALLGCADDAQPAEPDESAEAVHADAGEGVVEPSPQRPASWTPPSSRA